METHNIQGVEMTQYISDEISLTLFLCTLCFILSTYLLLNYIFALASETYRWLNNKYKGEVYIFHFPNPISSIKNCIIRTKNWFSTKIKQIKTAVQAVKDIQILIIETSGNEQLKHAFMAYTFIVAITAITAYNFLGLAYKYDFISIFKQLF